MSEFVLIWQYYHLMYNTIHRHNLQNFHLGKIPNDLPIHLQMLIRKHMRKYC